MDDRWFRLGDHGRYHALIRRLPIERLGLIDAATLMLIQTLGVALFLLTPLWAHLVTLRGIASKSPGSPSASRFNLSDGMILVALLSIATTFGARAPINRDSQNWILIGSLNFFVVLMWYKCIRFMATSGITENRSRIAMQLFTYPSAILSMSLFLICSLLVIIGSIASLVPDYNDPVVRELPNNLLFLVASCGWIYLTRASFRAIRKRSPAAIAG